VAILCHADDVLAGVREVHLALPRHHTKNIQRKQSAFRVQSSVRTLQEVSNYVGTLPVRMYLLEGEAGVFLVAFGREADIIELDLIRSTCDGCFGQSNV